MRRLLLLLMVLMLAGCSAEPSVPASSVRPRLDQQPSWDNPPESNNQLPLPPLVPGTIIRIPTSASQGVVNVSCGVPGLSVGRIALTFDAGWEFEHTHALLKVLADHKVKATFFLRGKWATDHPELVTAIALDGHSVQNHSYTHPHMPLLTPAEQRHEIEQTTAVIEELTTQRPWLFRPPYGEHNAAIMTALSETGYAYNVLWTVDTLDWMGSSAEAIKQRVERGLKDGCIILMHVGGAQTVAALPGILQLAKEEGYTPALVDELLPPAQLDGELLYRVQPEDSWEELAAQYRLTVSALLMANR